MKTLSSWVPRSYKKMLLNHAILSPETHTHTHWLSGISLDPGHSQHIPQRWKRKITYPEATTHCLFHAPTVLWQERDKYIFVLRESHWREPPLASSSVSRTERVLSKIWSTQVWVTFLDIRRGSNPTWSWMKPFDLSTSSSPCGFPTHAGSTHSLTCFKKEPEIPWSPICSLFFSPTTKRLAREIDFFLIQTLTRSH